jgi:hypothetical protein
LHERLERLHHPAKKKRIDGSHFCFTPLFSGGFPLQERNKPAWRNQVEYNQYSDSQQISLLLLLLWAG